MFGRQVSTEYLVLDLFFFLAAFMVLLGVAGLTLIDTGAVRRQHALDTAVQKIAAVFSAGLGMMLIGYPIWQWQFNNAFGVKNSLGQAITDWWFGGDLVHTFSTSIDPTVLPEVDVLQIFFAFFITFAMLGGALLHGALIERIRIVPLIIASFLVGAVVEPVLGFLLWGSLSPLTNNGFHDYTAIMPLYIGVGMFSLAFNLFIRPRLGRFDPHPSGVNPVAANPAVFSVGVLLLLTAIPFITIGSGYIVPDVGYFGISFASTGIGVVSVNLLAAFIGGGLAGVIIGYRRKQAFWALFGPLAGYVITGTLLDVGTIVEVFLVSLFGPPLMLVGYLLLERLRIDDPKLAPLAILPGIVGAIATGFIAWHTKQGGYPGLEGEYALQGTQITPWMQMLGTAIAVAAPFILGVVVAFILKKTCGLRISEDDEIGGRDGFWGSKEPAPAPAPSLMGAD